MSKLTKTQKKDALGWVAVFAYITIWRNILFITKSIIATAIIYFCWHFIVNDFFSVLTIQFLELWAIIFFAQLIFKVIDKNIDKTFNLEKSSE